MIIPSQGFDDLGQAAQASITFVKYTLVLGYRLDQGLRSSGVLEIKREELDQINIGDAPKELLFEYHPDWRKSVIKGRRITPFISTENDMINLHQDGASGRPQRRLASTLPRTVLSATNAAESRTALLVRREMQSWRLLQLEPSALRKSDEFNAPTQLGDDGSNLAATLYELARTHRNSETDQLDPEQIYTRVAKKLWELIDDVYQVTVDRDDKRELLTLQITDRNQTTHAARALSDGTLRFLALAVLEMDPRAQGVICLEEPENGIHPVRIPKILDLLQAIAVDTEYPVDDDNPLRQVIINTHSPLVVQLVPDDSLLIGHLVDERNDGNKQLQFSFLPDTWRTKATERQLDSPISRQDIAAYLGSTTADALMREDHKETLRVKPRTVRQNPYIQDQLELGLHFHDE